MTRLTGTVAFGEVRVLVCEQPGVSSVPQPCLPIPGISAGLSSGARPPRHSGSWLVRSSLAAPLGSWRGKRSAAVPSTKPHCSEQIRLELGCIFVK